MNVAALGEYVSGGRRVFVVAAPTEFRRDDASLLIGAVWIDGERFIVDGIEAPAIAVIAQGTRIGLRTTAPAESGQVP